jgi:hypothetical protein
MIIIYELTNSIGKTLDNPVIKCYNTAAKVRRGDNDQSSYPGTDRGGRIVRTMDTLESAPHYTMSVAARLAGVPAHALRTYEREGLLTPGRLGTRNRLYSDADIARARHIAELARQGINMAGIKAILRMEREHIT